MRHPNTIYSGVRTGGAGQPVETRVTVDREPLTLPTSLQVGTGFEWGYGGAGAAQLALALLLDATGDKDVAVRTFTWFKWAVVCNWGATWCITAGEVQTWVERFERADRSGVADAPHVVTAEGGVS